MDTGRVYSTCAALPMSGKPITYTNRAKFGCRSLLQGAGSNHRAGPEQMLPVQLVRRCWGEAQELAVADPFGFPADC